MPLWSAVLFDGFWILQQLTAQFGLDAHGRATRSAESCFILSNDSELVLGSLHQAAHGELTILGALLVAFLPCAFSSLPELNPVTQNLFAAIVLGPEPVDCDAVFGDWDDVNLSWLAGFIYKMRDRR